MYSGGENSWQITDNVVLLYVMHPVKMPVFQHSVMVNWIETHNNINSDIIGKEEMHDRKLYQLYNFNTFTIIMMCRAVTNTRLTIYDVFHGELFFSIKTLTERRE